MKSWKKTEILSSEEKFCWIEWENGGFEDGSVGEKGVCGEKELNRKSIFKK